MTVLETPEPFDGTPAEMFGLASNTELLAAWDEAIGRIEKSEQAAAAEDAVIGGRSSQ